MLPRRSGSIFAILILANTLFTNSFNLKNGLGLSRNTHFHSRFLEMKKKGGKVPIQQRGEFMRRQKIIDQKEAYDRENSKVTDVPVFEVFARPKV